MREVEKKLPQLSSLVLYTPDLLKTVTFYSKIGINFTEEKHGSGPTHYSAILGENQFLFEIYPGNKPPRLGFKVKSVKEVIIKCKELGIPPNPIKESKFGKFITIEDPTGRTIEFRQDPTYS
jgi:lactoylglutathione lyase